MTTWFESTLDERPWIRPALLALCSIDDAVMRWTRKHGITIMRVGLGIVFFWFGILKLVPGLSPAQKLIFSTITFVDPRWFIKVLAVWEMAIGVGLVTGVFMRATLLLFFLHMPGTALPLFMVPSAVWTRFPFGLTLEGQYIVKNFVLVGAALVIASRFRRGPWEAARAAEDGASSPSGVRSPTPGARSRRSS